MRWRRAWDTVCCLLLVWASVFPQLSPEEQKQGFRPLFNGKDLEGWRVYAGPEWKVQDGTLTGPTHASGWIGTQEEFGDFILRGEYWIDRGETPESNSGIFIRAATQGLPWVDGYEIQISLQDGNNPTGSLYGRVPTSLELVREIAPEKQWNRFEIRACGSHLQVWLNGHQVQDADLHERSRGVIGLQQHHPGVTVRFRNLRIKPLKASECEEGWQPLFNGRDLTGWSAKGYAQWEVKDGVITGRGGMGHLFTDRTFRDFECRAMVRISRNGNSGLYFRAHPPEDRPNEWPRGFEAQVWNHEGDYPTGSLYGRVRAKRILTRDEAWFALRIRAKGAHIQIWVNGQLMVDTESSDYKEGHFAIQCHDPTSVIQVRDLYWRPVRDEAREAPSLPHRIVRR